MEPNMSIERGTQRRQYERRGEDRRQRNDGAPDGMERRVHARRVGHRRADGERRGQ
tara:strand:- start:137 stop:304 length:168 start_codon:yes stop_codon:yes gene_type:complete